MTAVTEAPAAPAPATGAGSTSPKVKDVRFRVFRWKQGDETPRYDEFTVPIASRSTILDALTQIRVHQDRSLNLRHSCCHASCGTCGMRVNGKDVLACVTNVADLDTDRVTVEPLQNAPVVSDLVVDMTPFYEAFNPMDRPLVRTSEMIPDAGVPDGLAAYQRYEDCIECGICVSACPVASTDPHYLGPAALAAAERVLEEPRDADPKRALRLADNEHGIWRCHVAFECSEACPSSVEPGRLIMTLRRKALGARLARFGIGKGGSR
jgi:succinate dehydrogenase / fumarate reductase, iron-sulfur subunit